VFLAAQALQIPVGRPSFLVLNPSRFFVLLHFGQIFIVTVTTLVEGFLVLQGLVDCEIDPGIRSEDVIVEGVERGVESVNATKCLVPDFVGVRE
jgi:hypothetical protein